MSVAIRSVAIRAISHDDDITEAATSAIILAGRIGFDVMLEFAGRNIRVNGSDSLAEVIERYEEEIRRYPPVTLRDIDPGFYKPTAG